MSLIKSISGIRGTIGGVQGMNLTPIDIVKFATAYSTFIKNSTKKKKNSVVLGRDARLSGDMVDRLISATLIASGIDVINIGLATTPTTEMAVEFEKADGGIIITASHNPKQWNALKLLNSKGEFLNAAEGKEILDLSEDINVEYAEIEDIGTEIKIDNYHLKHIEKILELELVDVEAIKKANFKVVIDAVNSVGGIAIPPLLRDLGVEVIELYTEPTGHFPHNPEPLPEHLTELSATVIKNNAHLGFVVDPDVDRLAIVNEDGSMFGEEYTLVAVADYILSRKKGNTVSNLS
ncbi:MAG: phosphoglucosamine mutase, partial [Bacteroidales bacterium]|nr:phosphoglucosamine mutase [Bacteroidales bacterium]